MALGTQTSFCQPVSLLASNQLTILPKKKHPNLIIRDYIVPDDENIDEAPSENGNLLLEDQIKREIDEDSDKIESDLEDDEEDAGEQFKCDLLPPVADLDDHAVYIKEEIDDEIDEMDASHPLDYCNIKMETVDDDNEEIPNVSKVKKKPDAAKKKLNKINRTAKETSKEIVLDRLNYKLIRERIKTYITVTKTDPEPVEVGKKGVQKNGKTLYTCNECDVILISRGQLRSHMIRKHFPEFKPHKCKECGESYKWKTYLNQHMKVEHDHPGAVYKCVLCENAIFDSHKNLQKHIISVHHRPAIHKCEHCEESFPRKQEWRTHLKVTHSTIVDIHKCTLCDFQCQKRDKMNRHMTSVHESVERTFACDYCEMSFRLADDQRTHLRKVHKTNLVYKCNTCESRFTHKEDLLQHVRINHSPGASFHQCVYCLHLMASRAVLKKHIKKRHPGLLVPSFTINTVVKNGFQMNDDPLYVTPKRSKK